MNTLNALERFRRTSNLSFAEIARRAGFSSRSAVFQHCNGTRNISAESAIRYSRSLGIPLCELRPDLWEHEEQAAEAGEAHDGPQEAQDA